MATIEIRNLYCKVSNISLEGTRALVSGLSVKTPGCEFSTAYRKGYWDGRTNFYKKATNKFPTGLLSTAIRLLKNAGEIIDLEDKRNYTDYNMEDNIELLSNKGDNIILRDYQQEAVEKSLSQTRGVINVATNGGKTEIACGIIKMVLPHIKQGQTIAFFTHSKEIFSQTVNRLEERLGIEVGKVGSGQFDIRPVTVVMIPTVSRNMKTSNTNKEEKKIKKHIEKLNNNLSLHLIKYTNLTDNKQRKEYESKIISIQTEIEKETKKLESCKEVKQNKMIEFLDSIVMFIADEVHHASSDSWYTIFMSLKNAYFRFGLTGTIDTSDMINVMKLIGCTGSISYKISNEFLISRGYSAKPVINLLSLGKCDTIATPFYPDARRQGIILHEKRNELFVHTIVNRANLGKQCLIIVNETEHGNIIYDMLSSEIESICFIHGELKDNIRQRCLSLFKDGKLKVLIATSILDEGVDVSGINCLFLMSGGKSMRQLLQRIGRGLRKKEDGSCVEVYDCLDYHNEYLVEHTLERYNTYKNEGFEIRKL